MICKNKRLSTISKVGAKDFSTSWFWRGTVIKVEIGKLMINEKNSKTSIKWRREVPLSVKNPITPIYYFILFIYLNNLFINK